ncbi:MAG: TadE/TadG family type IV pilus assembly protein [Acidimicrobiia bacterium]
MWRKVRDNQRGAVLVEAAVVFPLLIMLTVGIWTTSRAWNIHNVLDHAAKEGARHGATAANEDGLWDANSAVSVRQVIERELQASAVNPSSVSMCIEYQEAGGDPCGLGDTTSDPKVQVTVTFPGHRLNFVFFGFTVDLRGAGVSRWEGDL